MSSLALPTRLATLVVDDDPFMAEILVVSLRDLGFRTVHRAIDGKEALEQLAAHSIQLLICDLNMPGMDGIHLMGHIAAAPVQPAIILLSGEDPRILDASRQLAEAKNLLVLGMLHKPINPGALADVLKRYHPLLESRQGSVQTIQLDEAALCRGLEQGALQLAHQPKIDLQNGALTGVESLLRWQDPHLGVIPPHAAIRTAEESGMIDALSRAILTRAVQDRMTLVNLGIDINVAINLSMYNLGNTKLVDQMSKIVHAAGDLPSRYTLEVTETHLVRDLAQVLETLIRARLCGFKIAIDDYGTGAATMQLLMQLPSTELKIDRVFVAMAPKHDLGRTLLKSVVDLGLQLGQTITAEGIETEEEAKIALDLGCQLGQGYLYGHPMPLEDLLAWHRNRQQAAPSTAKSAGGL